MSVIENISIKDYILWVKIFYKVNYFVYLQRCVGLCQRQMDEIQKIH